MLMSYTFSEYKKDKAYSVQEPGVNSLSCYPENKYEQILGVERLTKKLSLNMMNVSFRLSLRLAYSTHMLACVCDERRCEPGLMIIFIFPYGTNMVSFMVHTSCCVAMCKKS